MAYRSLEECLLDLEKHGELLRIKEEVDPCLEMAAIHLRVHAAGGPAILFEKVKGTKFRAASNIFGTASRCDFIFRDTLPRVKQLVNLKNDPLSFLKNPVMNLPILFSALFALPKRNPFKKPVLFEKINISELPQIVHWPKDGGAFVTLPQVYTEDLDMPGIMHANMGMYRIQLSGNQYEKDREIGLHYQLHRGIGVHQTKAAAKAEALPVSVFVGGPPAHSVAAVMPLPENLGEATFAGSLAGRRFGYVYKDGFAVSTDADFVITGTVETGTNKPEGPFGDHLGYYSLQHDFPVMRVHAVYARRNAIWPFTVVGRPPQEDTAFGNLVHRIAGGELQREIPGLRELNAVDAAGVHPLLLAIGSERYTPYAPATQPAELLTIANRILGAGQLSLAKFLFITADPDKLISTNEIKGYFEFLLSRIDLKRDLHFYTNTTIDTLDYSGSGLNTGSKLVLAAVGNVRRTLANFIPHFLMKSNAQVVMPGVIAIALPRFTDYEKAADEMKTLTDELLPYRHELDEFPIIVACDDPAFVAETMNNFLWTAFTRTNPAADVYGVGAFTHNKHWGCEASLILDARSKRHHAPPLELDPAIDYRAEQILQRAGWSGEAKVKPEKN